MQQLLSHHQCVASSTVDPAALVTPICAVMRAGSLKTFGIGPLNKSDQVVQVLKELPHCTHLSELELSLSDEVRHVNLCIQCINNISPPTIHLHT